MARKGKKDIAKFLFCLSVLEGKAFQLYGRISEKVGPQAIKFSLLYLAYDSLKNSAILEELSKNLARSMVRDKDYERILGDVWRMVNDLSSQILKMKSIGEKKLLWLSNKLIVIYSVTLVQLKTLGFMTKEISEAYNVNLGDIQEVLSLVIADEEVDTQVLMAIKDSVGKQERGRATIDNTPAVKYSNPDMWYRPETAHWVSRY